LSKASTGIPRYKVWVIPITRLSLTNLVGRLFAGSDARARQYGWQVTQVQRGFGRRYRDPRFDHFIRCSSCAGTGWTGPGWAGPGVTSGTPCKACRGTGRLTRAAPETRAETERPPGTDAAWGGESRA
jgi:hypothetical protein